jgi:hypothetical protein
MLQNALLGGMRYSRAHVAGIILSSLIIFGSAPSAAAQSHLPQCPSDRNQVWNNCTGVYGYPDGSRYFGEFTDNKRSGQGTLTFANGDKYVGEWSDGKENGQGTYTFVSGDKYVGDWWDSKRNGRGTQTYSDGSSYVGEWRDDKKMDEAPKRTHMEVPTLASSEATKGKDRERSRGLMEPNTSVNGGIIKKMDRASIHFPAATNTSAK